MFTELVSGKEKPYINFVSLELIGQGLNDSRNVVHGQKSPRTECLFHLHGCSEGHQI